MKCMKMRQDFGRSSCCLISCALPSNLAEPARFVTFSLFIILHFFWKYSFFQMLWNCPCPLSFLQKGQFLSTCFSTRGAVHEPAGDGGSLVLHAVCRGAWRPISCAPFPYLQSGINTFLFPPAGTLCGLLNQCSWSCWEFLQKGS